MEVKRDYLFTFAQLVGGRAGSDPEVWSGPLALISVLLLLSQGL